MTACLVIFLSSLFTASAFFTSEDYGGLESHDLIRLRTYLGHAPLHSANQALADDLYLLGLYLTPQGPVSDQCRQDGNSYLQNLLVQTEWALRLFDATPTFPQGGLFQGNIYHFPGFYSSCLKTMAPGFRGQHCLSAPVDPDGPGIPIVNQQPLLNNFLRSFEDSRSKVEDRSLNQLPGSALSSTTVRLGQCVPSSCSKEDVKIGLDFYFEEALRLGSLNLNISSQVLNCHHEDEEIVLDTADWVMIGVLIFFGICIVVGTGVDMLLFFTPFDKVSQYAVQLCQGFSLYSNSIKVFDTKSSSDALKCINGIRFISMTWVLLGHVFVHFAIGIFLNNMFYMYDENGPLSTTAFLAVYNAQPSVDSFFLIGATLVSYLTLKQLDKTKGSFKTWVLFYVHRYIRLTGVYAIVIGLHATLIKYFMIGPASYLLDIMEGPCKKNWWWNILYINNFLDSPEEYCLQQSWYLANDMQFYVISPLIIYPLWKLKAIGLVIAGMFTVAATVIPIYMTAVNDELFTGDFVDFYTKPWNRFQPYIIGLLLGFILHELKGKKLMIPSPINQALWILATATGAAVVYGLNNHAILDTDLGTLGERVAYNGFSRLAWSLALGWLILACCKKMGGPINEFLSWRAFIPLSRMTYSTYLVHISVVSWMSTSVSYVISYSNQAAVYHILPVLLMSVFVAYLLVVCFEMPIMHMEKLLLASVGLAQMPKPVLPEQPKNCE